MYKKTADSRVLTCNYVQRKIALTVFKTLNCDLYILCVRIEYCDIRALYDDNLLHTAYTYIHCKTAKSERNSSGSFKRART